MWKVALQVKPAAQVESLKRAPYVLQHISKEVTECTLILCKAAGSTGIGSDTREYIIDDTDP